jgi:hypothetical protein
MTLDGLHQLQTPPFSRNQTFGSIVKHISKKMSIFLLIKVCAKHWPLVQNISYHSLAGYPLTPYTIRPFSQPDLTNDETVREIRKRWNVKLSSTREAVEHVFGRLKGRFPILKSIPGSDMQSIYKMVESLLVLHNILHEFGDDPAGIPDYNPHEDVELTAALTELRQQASNPDQNSTILRRLGLSRRKILVDVMLDMEKENR